MSARDLLLGQGKSILISRKNVCWRGAPAWPCLNAWWFWRQWCREIKGYSLSVVQHTASCQIKSKSNTTQSKAAPQSYPSIIWCKNGRQVYVGPTSIIHAFIRKTCRGEMNRSFNFFAFISLSGRWRNPPHHYLVHRTQTQTHNNTLMKLRDSSIFWATLAELTLTARHKTNCCTAVSLGEQLKVWRWQRWWLSTVGPNQVWCIIVDVLEKVCVSARHLPGIVFQS